MFHRHPLLSALTGAYLVFVGWLTLTPQALHGRESELLARVVDALHRRGRLESMDYADAEFYANVAMFVPIGVFLLLLFGTGGWWAALAACFAMTAGIEYAQQYVPGRVSDERDLIANGLGAVIGVFLAVVLTLPTALQRQRQRTARASARY